VMGGGHLTPLTVPMLRGVLYIACSGHYQPSLPHDHTGRPEILDKVMHGRGNGHVGAHIISKD